MSVTRTVVPGDWYGVLGESVIVLVPPTARSRVSWPAVTGVRQAISLVRRAS